MGSHLIQCSRDNRYYLSIYNLCNASRILNQSFYPPQLYKLCVQSLLCSTLLWTERKCNRLYAAGARPCLILIIQGMARICILSQPLNAVH